MKSPLLALSFVVLALSNAAPARAESPSPYAIKCTPAFTPKGGKYAEGQPIIVPSKLDQDPSGNSVLIAKTGEIAIAGSNIVLKGASLTARAPAPGETPDVKNIRLSITHQDAAGGYQTSYGLQFLAVTFSDASGTAWLNCQGILN